MNMAAETKTYKPQIKAVIVVDLGASFTEMKRQERIASDEQLVMDAFESVGLPDAPVPPEVDGSVPHPWEPWPTLAPLSQ